MAKVAQRKTFAQHSERWQRQALREGVDPKRWDHWIKLAPSSRRASDPRRYAQGESVAAQRMDAKREQVSEKILRAFPDARSSTVRRGVQGMTTAQLNAVLKRDGAKLSGYIRTKARSNVPGERNPFWYR